MKKLETLNPNSRLREFPAGTHNEIVRVVDEVRRGPMFRRRALPLDSSSDAADAADGPPGSLDQQFYPYLKARCENRTDQTAYFGEARYLQEPLPHNEDRFKRNGRYCPPEPPTVEVVQATFHSAGDDPISSASLTSITLDETPLDDDLVIVWARTSVASVFDTEGITSAPSTGDSLYINAGGTVWPYLNSVGADTQHINDATGVTGSKFFPSINPGTNLSAVYAWGDQIGSDTFAVGTGGSGGNLYCCCVTVLRGVKRNTDDSVTLLERIYWSESDERLRIFAAETTSRYADDFQAGKIFGVEISSLDPDDYATGTPVNLANSSPGALALDFCVGEFFGTTSYWRTQPYTGTAATGATLHIQADNTSYPATPGASSFPRITKFNVASRVLSGDENTAGYTPTIPDEANFFAFADLNTSQTGSGGDDTLFTLVFEPGEPAESEPETLTLGPPDQLVADLPKLAEPVRGDADKSAARQRLRDDWRRPIAYALETIGPGATGWFAVAEYALAWVYVRNPRHNYAAPLAASTQLITRGTADGAVTAYLRRLRRIKRDNDVKAIDCRPQFLVSTNSNSGVRLVKPYRDLDYWRTLTTPASETLTATLDISSGVGAIIGVASDQGTPTVAITAGDTLASGDLRELWPEFDYPGFAPVSSTGTYGRWVLTGRGLWTYTLDAALVSGQSDGTYEEEITFTVPAENEGPPDTRRFACGQPFFIVDPEADDTLEAWLRATRTDADDYTLQPGLVEDDEGFIEVEHKYDPLIGRVPGSLENKEGLDLRTGLQLCLVRLSGQPTGGDCC